MAGAADDGRIRRRARAGARWAHARRAPASLVAAHWRDMLETRTRGPLTDYHLGRRAVARGRPRPGGTQLGALGRGSAHALVAEVPRVRGRTRRGHPPAP